MTWKDYLKKTNDKGPHTLLKEAVSYCVEKRRALDLGAGGMRDARYLLEQGFQVDAVDSNPEIQEYCPSEVVLYVETFDSFTYPENTYDIVNAQFALPFNPPDTFKGVFGKLQKSLKPNGIFAGQFLGPEDSWAGSKGMTFHSKQEVEDLLPPLKILRFEEEKKQGKTALGKEKFWHIFHIIAQKR